MLYIVIFAVVGGYLSGFQGILIGIFLGFIYYRIDDAFTSIKRLQESVDKLQTKVRGISREIYQPKQAKEKHPDEKKTGQAGQTEECVSEAESLQKKTKKARPAAQHVQAAEGRETGQEAKASQSTENVGENVSFFMTLGSQLYRAGTVVQTGIVLLLFGLVFLVRYATENQQFTVEAGLMATMIVGMILLFVGWLLIRTKRAYALMLQGGSVAILFTCLFLSTEVYSLFPVVVSFMAMICLSILAGLLAVQYKARETALIGMGGGFAAPLLSPVTSDQLIFLFSYYFVLVLGIFAVSRVRNWRVLQLLSFLFIVFVGVFLGRTEDILHVRTQLEPFLFLFFLFYATIEVMTARKQETAWGNGLNGLNGIDFTLILGPPLACIAFQAALSYPNAMEFFSMTLALLSLYYGSNAYWLWRTFAAKRLMLLILVFASLAYIFVNALLIIEGGKFALPLLIAYYGASVYFLRRFLAPTLLVQVGTCLTFCCVNLLVLYKTGIIISTLIYNVEAVCWVWIAARKKQQLSFWLGIILLVLAFFPIIVSFDQDALVLFQVHPLLVLPVGLSFSLAPFICALLLNQVNQLKESFGFPGKEFINGLFLWAIFLWLATGVTTVITGPVDGILGLILLFISLSFLTLRLLGQRLSLPFFGKLCDGYGITLSILAILHLCFFIKYPENLSLSFILNSCLGWLVAIGIHYALLLTDKTEAASSYRSLNHRLGVWLVGSLLIMQIYSALTFSLHLGPVWLSSFFGMSTGCFMLALLLLDRKLQWPVRRYPLDYQGYGILPFALFAWGWTLNACLSLGDPAPLIYIPLLNPVELSQCLCLTALFLWAKILKRPALQALPLPAVIKNNLGIILSGTLALCLTMMVARTVCYYTDIVFSADGILFSSFFQTIISIIWSAVAFVIMLFSVRSKQERLNALGTMLLFLVAAKLFLVDFHLSQEIERICSFMWVGAIMLLAGYFIPTDKEVKSN
ncbi:MAG: DUF2339 domain-containing protein [Candidatus Electrothrix sp. AU1_5]|nr:DUF2339 domain-containing protein [Candidatus Electrothrix gigas]